MARSLRAHFQALKIAVGAQETRAPAYAKAFHPRELFLLPVHCILWPFKPAVLEVFGTFPDMMMMIVLVLALSQDKIPCMNLRVT